MFVQIKKYFLSLIFILTLSNTYCQYIPFVIDTISHENNKILIYSDRTWSYFQEYNIDSTSISCLDTTSLFTANWNNKSIFAYLGEPQTREKFEVEILDSNKIFSIPICGKFYRGFSRGHDGVDIGLSKGDSVKAAFDGKVRYSAFNRGGYGNLVIMRHYNGLETYYAHLSKLLVKADQEVKAGQTIGLGGSTGRSVSPHLHFEVRYRDKPIDPQKIIDFEKSQIISGCRLLVDNNKNEPRPLRKNSTHKVKRGDTLQKIAKMYGTTVQKICKLNNISAKKPLKRGKRIKVS